MAHSLSAKKRIRQNATRRARNRARKKEIKLRVRALNEALADGDAGKATDCLRAAIKKIDQVAARGAIHKNAAARKKSRLARRLGQLAK